MKIIQLGRTNFAEALRLQDEAVRIVAQGGDEVVYLLEHPPVYTLGRRAREANLLVPPTDEEQVPVFRINRGGDVTYHGPGQLVGYLHLDLNRRGRDVHRYLRQLEELLIQLARRFEVTAFRREGLTGVWTDRGKLASIGVGVRRWVTMHGFALNVDPDFRYFQRINPCGIPGCPLTSLRIESPRPVTISEVRQAVEALLPSLFPPLETTPGSHTSVVLSAGNRFSGGRR